MSTFSSARSPSHVVVRQARPGEAASVAWLAAVTFPLACPPGTAVSTMAAHIGTHLTPVAFRGWAESDRHALLVAVPPDEVTTHAGAGTGATPLPDGRHGENTPLGYALVALGRPDGAAEADVLRSVAGPGPYAELSKIYVLPEAQGSGIAGLLMDAAVTAARELAARAGSPAAAVWLGTNGENRRAQAFYRKHGFELVGHRTYDVGGVAHDDVVMLHRPA